MGWLEKTHIKCPGHPNEPQPASFWVVMVIGVAAGERPRRTLPVMPDGSGATSGTQAATTRDT